MEKCPLCIGTIATISDLIFNLTLVFRSINDLSKWNNTRICELLSMFSHLAELLSAAYTVHFTIQRYFAVKYPLKTTTNNRKSLNSIALTLTTSFSLVYCVLLVHYNSYYQCNEELNLKWFLSDALLSFVFPFALIALFNLLIVQQIQKESKKITRHHHRYRYLKHKHSQTTLQHVDDNSERVHLCRISRSVKLITSEQQCRKTDVPIRKLRQTTIRDEVTTDLEHSKCQFLIMLRSGRYGSPFRSSNIIRHDEQDIDSKSPVKSTYPSQKNFSLSNSCRISRMLIIASTCFLLLNAPSHICIIQLKVYTLTTSKQFANTNNSIEGQQTFDVRTAEYLYLSVLVTQLLSFSSYSINFFLYSFCGAKFRRDLIHFFSQRSTRASLHLFR
ncbi:unnamed protein product [Didymodactylos carnosus]|uniref:G-protein coupled receptors family 1 profile domain-containing protein n=1 Tax=Didymodactylos carnosus TaxID=1234261 RepID=A0A814R324_9BILA|nr:unnamed protein product [Didymodactylos carnosus]CAF3892118.1 unnamed protein product [Didymodactylos carnosus]